MLCLLVTFLQFPRKRENLLSGISYASGTRFTLSGKLSKHSEHTKHSKHSKHSKHGELSKHI
jgi:hypothetical protein